MPPAMSSVASNPPLLPPIVSVPERAGDLTEIGVAAGGDQSAVGNRQIACAVRPDNHQSRSAVRSHVDGRSETAVGSGHGGCSATGQAEAEDEVVAEVGECPIGYRERAGSIVTDKQIRSPAPAGSAQLRAHAAIDSADGGRAERTGVVANSPGEGVTASVPLTNSNVAGLAALTPPKSTELAELKAPASTRSTPPLWNWPLMIETAPPSTTTPSPLSVTVALPAIVRSWPTMRSCCPSAGGQSAAA